MDHGPVEGTTGGPYADLRRTLRILRKLNVGIRVVCVVVLPGRPGLLDHLGLVPPVVLSAAAAATLLIVVGIVGVVTGARALGVAVLVVGRAVAAAVVSRVVGVF